MKSSPTEIQNKIYEIKKEIEKSGTKTGEFLCPICFESFIKDRNKMIIHNKKTGHSGDYNCYYPILNEEELYILKTQLLTFQEAQKIFDEERETLAKKSSEEIKKKVEELKKVLISRMCCPNKSINTFQYARDNEEIINEEFKEIFGDGK